MTAWLLDQCPPDYRMYAGLRRYPVVLARFAALNAEASIEATRRGISAARTDLRDLLPAASVQGAIEMWEREQARLFSVATSIALIEQALRGTTFVPRLS